MIQKFKVGDRVEFIDAKVAGLGGFFPPVGTKGTILRLDKNGDVDVKWDEGVQHSPLGWSCHATRIRKCNDEVE